MVHNLQIGSTLFDPAWDSGQQLFPMPVAVAHYDASNHRCLVSILSVDLGGRHIELSMECDQKRLQPAPLFL